MSISNGSPIEGGDKPYRVTDAAAAAFTLVEIDATNSTNLLPTAVQTTANTGKVIGILQEPTTAANQSKPVRTMGIGRLKVNGNSDNIAAGDQIVSAAGGIGVKAATASATLQYVIGIAQAPATTDGAFIDVQIQIVALVKGTA